MKKTLLLTLMVLSVAPGLRAQGCGPAVAPWWADFSSDSSLSCWSAYGNATWTRHSSGSSHRLRVELSNAAGDCTGWLLSQPIVLPADSSGLKFFWSESRGNNTSSIDSMNMTLRVLVTDSLGTAPFDTLYTGSAYQPNGSLHRRTVSLAAYAGQTVRVAFAVGKNSSAPNRYMLITDVMARSDRMPVLNNLTTPGAVVETGQVLTCHIRLAEGDTAGLHYSWSSLVGGVFTLRGRGDTATLVYGAGISGEYDTVTVTATNPYGSSTKSRAVRVIDCTPATVLPWYEPFANGLHCWLRPWAQQYVSEWFVSSGSLRSVCNSDTLDSWVISKAVTIPPAAGDSVRLSWREWKLYDDWPGFVYNYQVMATASSDYADSTQYAVLYSGGDLSTQPTVRSVSLAPFAGQTIHIAFRNRSGNTMGTVSGSAYYNTLCVDSIVVDSRADSVPEPPDTVWRMVSAVSADVSLGSVTGGGRVPDSSMVTLLAEPSGLDTRVAFDHWNDGDTSNPRQVFVVSDTAFVAHFRMEEDSVGIAGRPSPTPALWLYPNPTSGKVVMACAAGIATVSLTDMAGRGYLVPFSSQGEGKYVLDLACLPQGNYLLTVVTASGKRHHVRLAKQ